MPEGGKAGRRVSHVPNTLRELVEEVEEVEPIKCAGCGKIAPPDVTERGRVLRGQGSRGLELGEIAIYFTSCSNACERAALGRLGL
jgi:hypothetical protein